MCTDTQFANLQLGRDITFEEKLALLKQVPLKRLGSSTEIAELVNFLASHQSKHMTGSVLTMDGGESLGI